jgi:hypothetical protein
MFGALLAGMFAGYAIAVPVGVIAVLIIETGMMGGLRRGLAAGAGAATVDLLFCSLALVVGGLLNQLFCFLVSSSRSSCFFCAFLSPKPRVASNASGPNKKPPNAHIHPLCPLLSATALANIPQSIQKITSIVGFWLVAYNPICLPPFRHHQTKHQHLHPPHQVPLECLAALLVGYPSSNKQTCGQGVAGGQQKKASRPLRLGRWCLEFQFLLLVYNVT